MHAANWIGRLSLEWAAKRAGPTENGADLARSVKWPAAMGEGSKGGGKSIRTAESFVREPGLRSSQLCSLSFGP